MIRRRRHRPYRMRISPGRNRPRLLRSRPSMAIPSPRMPAPQRPDWLHLPSWLHLPAWFPVSLPNWRWAPWYEPPAPKRHPLLRVLDAISYLATGWLLLRPWLRRLGANQAELRRTYPGDELYGHAEVVTRAITIEARAADIWPWIVQMGYGRAGWYSLSLIDNRGRASANRILPEHQQLEVGDEVPSGPRSAFRVHDIESHRFLVLTYDGKAGGASWLFWLEPIDDNRTRLVERIRGHAASNPLVALTQILGDAGDVVMMLTHLHNLKRRAERTASERQGGGGASGAAPSEDGPPAEAASASTQPPKAASESDPSPEAASTDTRGEAG